MLPLKDDVSSQSFPLITVLLIAANVAAFLYQASLEAGTGGTGRAATAFVMEFGAVPCRLTGRCLADDSTAPIVTVFTSMFLHGGLFHIAGNMLYLWIFGDNIEDAMGHARYLVFYLLCGLAASAAQVAVSLGNGAHVPELGASGAIAGVLGAYIVLYPHARVNALLTLGFFFTITRVSALLVIGLWFVLQFAQALGQLGQQAAGGVAVWAHVGGFVAGALLVQLFRRRERRYAGYTWQ